MARLLAGIDWSSQRIDIALVPIVRDSEDSTVPPVTFRHEPLPKRDGDRVTAAFLATRRLLRDVTIDTAGGGRARHQVESVWIEEAFGAHMNSTRVLLPIFGAMWAAAGTLESEHGRGVAVASLSPPEWRRELGLQSSGKYPKDRSIERAWESLGLRVDEHQAEALLVALAGKQITWRHHEQVSTT